MGKRSWWLAGSLLFAPGPGSACLLDIGLNGNSPSFTYLFPNWTKTDVTDFDLQFCDTTTCPGYADGDITGLTIFNYGTATGGGAGDLGNVYVCFGCSRSSGGACTPTYTLTYAGVWTVGVNNYPAWTWDPATPVVLNTDPCNGGPGGCACIFVMHVFVDVNPCPTAQRTVRMGPGFNDVLNPGWPGGIYDQYGCNAPWGDLADPSDKVIVYAVKEGDKTAAAPGDTVTYTLYYGLPGSSPLTNVVLFDTIPASTHYLTGSGTPAPDVAWDPDWGPPIRLKWTRPGGATTGGPSSMVTFQLTVDWGNGETFEPGSGDVAAPEGSRLDNRVNAEFLGASCALKTYVSAPTTTSVRRFLFWKLGDNDLLYSPTYGQPPDEMIYSIFIKNLSTTKTWWNVAVWDTVPPQLDPWGIGFGFDDPCSGWTMSPSGCAAATPGYVLSGPNTLLTWRLDMPPQMTIELKWKSAVRPTVAAGQTAVNQAAVLEYGRANIVDGTGHSGVPRQFNHLAPIVLPTTYISYVAFAAGDNDRGCPGFIIDFFPLNKKTQFELRGIQHLFSTAPWPGVGGPSQPIGCLIGDCLGGFGGNAGCTLGSGAIPGGGVAGCKVERVPAIYDPAAWHDVCPAKSDWPLHFIYKVTANAPVLWQYMTYINCDCQDSHTYAPSTTVTYRGLMHYMARRGSNTLTPGYGDSLVMVNTGLDAYGNLAPTLSTTVHLFYWEYATLSWQYQRTYEIAPESLAYDFPVPNGFLAYNTTPAGTGMWRAVSSDAQMIISEESNTASSNGCCCGGCMDNFGALMPTRETGNLVGGAGSNFYGLAEYYTETHKVIVGNVGAATAKYEIFKYIPDNTIAIAPMPSLLNGTSGSWVSVAVDTVPAGLANANNPHDYGAAFNAPSAAYYRINVISGGPVQIYNGVRLFSGWGGGAVLHASNVPAGVQTGTQYWFHQESANNGGCGGGPGLDETVGLDVFCPKTGTVVQCVSEDGYTATYTTNGTDECVAFLSFTSPGTTAKRNYRVDVLSGGAVVCMYNQCKITEKGFTAPFVETGTHYVIIAPPVVFSGSPFWITVVVLSQGGATKTDYCGTSSFTSSDPLAKIENTGMDTYNFTWSSLSACNSAPNEDGIKIFFRVSFNALGLQSIVATDTQDGSITGVTAVMVVGADIKLQKTPRLTVGASGDTVSFRVCWSNYSSASAFTFVVTDAIPMGTTFVPEASSSALDCGNTRGVVPQVAYSTATSTTPPAAFTNGNPVAGTRWLRWTVPSVDIFTSGCLCYRVTVN